MTEAVTVPTMEVLISLANGATLHGGGEIFEQPVNLRWINKPCVVTGESFQYDAYCLLSFPKRDGTKRYIVEDRGRLFIQRESQIKFMDARPEWDRSVPSVLGTGSPIPPFKEQTIGEALEIAHRRHNKETTHYVHFNGSSHFVKEAQFFIDQGGLKEEWGRNWRGVLAQTVEEARVLSKSMDWSKKRGSIYEGVTDQNSAEKELAIAEGHTIECQHGIYKSGLCPYCNDPMGR